MCGIVGITRGNSPTKNPTGVASLLVDGLKRLEYRGYDSAGICLTYKDKLYVYKSVGRVSDLDRNIPDGVKSNKAFTTGIAHTRWATHGGVTEANTHPHISMDGRIAVVHNGIIDNADELRAKLEDLGYKFVSETDTEVLAHLLQHYRDKNPFPDEPSHIVAMARSIVKGTYGLAAVFSDYPDTIVVARMGSPLVVGIGEDASYIASDVSPIARYTNRVVYLEDGDIMTVRPGVLTAWDNKTPDVQEINVVDAIPEMGSYDSYMLKEIFEQPAAIKRCFGGRIRDNNCILGGFNLGERNAGDVSSVTIIGCGTSYHAGLVGASLIEEFAGIPARVEIASEYAEKKIIRDPKGIYLAISQSGETYDTIECIKELREKACDVYGIVNTVGSTIARLCGKGVYIHAGPEIAVASTKAFTSQVAALSMLAIMLGRAKQISSADGERLCAALKSVPDLVAQQLEYYSSGRGLEQIKRVSESLAGAKYALFLGRGPSYPVALEGALKLKEIAYVPCEAYPGGEMKHGPIAMIEKNTPVIITLPDDQHSKKMLSNMREVEARGATIYDFAPYRAPAPFPFSPLLTVIPMQLIAYHTAKLKGLDIDKPRNLAKSVTV